MRAKLPGLLLFVLLLPTSVASAAIQYAGEPGGGSWYYGGGGTAGTEFTSNITTSVLSLGIYDYGNDGLYGAHEVGLWDSSNALIAWVTIPAGNSAPLLNGYRWVTASASLVAGQHYVIGAGYYGAGESDWFRDSATIDPAFSLVRDLYTDGGSPLARPTTSYQNSSTFGWFGPNVEVGDIIHAAATVPEPASLLLWGLLGLTFGGACWWRQRKFPS